MLNSYKFAEQINVCKIRTKNSFYKIKFLMDSTLKPYGHSTMITLGFVIQILISIFYLISIGMAFALGNFLVEYGPAYQIFYFIGSPILVFFSFLILLKLRKKQIEAFSLIKIIFPIAISISTIIFIEGLALPVPLQLTEFFNVILNIGVLLYWNNPAHVQYFRSFKN